MATIPKTLVIGRCWRCGRKLRMYDDYYVCPKCGALYCVTCAERKLFLKCAADGTQLVKR